MTALKRLYLGKDAIMTVVPTDNPMWQCPTCVWGEPFPGPVRYAGPNQRDCEVCGKPVHAMFFDVPSGMVTLVQIETEGEQ